MKEVTSQPPIPDDALALRHSAIEGLAFDPDYSGRAPLTNEEIAALAPGIGSVWTHRNNGLYEVTEHLNCEGDDLAHRLKYPPSVAYRSANGKKWVRRIDDWHRSMTLESDGPHNISPMAYFWACWRLSNPLDWRAPIFDRPEFGGYTFGFLTGRVVGFDKHHPRRPPEFVELKDAGPTYYGNKAPKKLVLP